MANVGHPAENMTDAEIDVLLERFDQTDPALQRRIIADFVCRVAALADTQALLLSACRAAVAYDAAIQRAAAAGKSWVENDDLDKLYDAWLTKTKEAVAAVEKPA